MDTAEFKEVFAAEARDYLQSLNESLLSLENNPNDKELLDDMFRAAHSLKGMSGTMGFEALASFTHHMESVLDLLRNDELSASLEVVNGLFHSVDTLEVLLDQTLEGSNIEDVSSVVQILQGLMQSGQSHTKEAVLSLPRQAGTRLVLDEFDKETLKQGLDQGYLAHEITVTLKPNTLLKSVRVYTVFQALEAIGTIIKCQPSAQDLEEERFEQEFSLLLLTHEKMETVEAIINGISEIAHVLITDPTLGSGDQLHQNLSTSEDASPSASSDAAHDGTPSKERPQKGRFADKFVRVETDRLDKLINLVGELVISRTQVLEMGKTIQNADEKSTILQLDRITTDLQYAAMKLRMVPIKQVFDRFPRMVRDLADRKSVV